jgi:hypothetical protein
MLGDVFDALTSPHAVSLSSLMPSISIYLNLVDLICDFILSINLNLI